MILRNFRTLPKIISKLRFFSVKTDQSNSFRIQQILEVSSDPNIERIRPKKVKNIHEEYIPRPLYNLALKGNHAFKEAIRTLTYVPVFLSSIFLALMAYKYIEIEYFLTSEEKEKLEKLRAEESFDLQSIKKRYEDVETLTEWGLGGHIDIIRKSEVMKINPSLPKPEPKEISKTRKWLNVDVLPREIMEKNPEPPRSLKDFDERLR